MNDSETMSVADLFDAAKAIADFEKADKMAKEELKGSLNYIAKVILKESDPVAMLHYMRISSYLTAMQEAMGTLTAGLKVGLESLEDQIIREGE